MPRDALTQPFSQPNSARLMTPNFRGTYSNAAAPAMETALDGKDIHRAINAIMVLSQLGTSRASDALTRNADLQNQSIWQIRLQAANGERMLLQSGALEGRRATEACRRLRDAASREDNGLVLRHQFAALAAADNPSLQGSDLTAARDALAQAVAATARKVAGKDEITPSEVVALASAIVTLRNRYPTQYNSTEQKNVGEMLGPVLGSLLEWTKTHWDKVRSNESMTNDMGILITACETLLQRIDFELARSRQPPPVNMHAAWTSGDKPKFDAAVTAWQALLAKAPYKP